jgi:hypothetical protein
MDLNWRNTASEMKIATAGKFVYSIFRPGDSGYWSVGRTHAEDAIMVTVGTKFETLENAQDAASTDYELQPEDEPEETGGPNRLGLN